MIQNVPFRWFRDACVYGDASGCIDNPGLELVNAFGIQTRATEHAFFTEETR
jgi:hypothetical protein